MPLYLGNQSIGNVNVRLTSGGATTPTLQAKTVDPKTSRQVVQYDSGYDGLSSVTVNAIQTETASITSNGTYTPTSGKFYSQVTVNVPTSGGDVNLQERTVTPSESQQVITPGTGYDGLSKVTVNAIPSDYIGSAVSFATYYTGTDDPASSLGVDGDIYLKA